MERIDVRLIRVKETPYDPEEISSLCESIKEQGLLHPVTVHKVNTGHYELIAGFKRFQALKMLEFPVIPCEVKEGEMNDDQKTELRLHENLKRGNLPWGEQVILVKQLHELRQKTHGAARPTGGGSSPDGSRKTGWSIRDTAEELKKQFGGTGSIGGVAQDLQLATAITIDPSLAKVKDKRTALRLIKLEKARKENELFTGLPTEDGEERERLEDEIFLGDSLEVLKHMPEEYFHACITDPPWLRYAPGEGTGLVRDESTPQVFEQVYRVLKRDSFLYVIVGHEDFVFYLEELPKLGFKVQTTPLIWVKTGGLSRRGVAPWQYARDFEFILVAVKGAPVLTSATQMSSILTYKVIPSVKLQHPHEKPPDLIKKLITDCTYRNAFILDPFMGSGVVCETARSMGRHYVGIERDPEFFAKIRKRLDR